ncbi:c6 zinc finger [Fusarium albosuccineum]|uniref:C6 zinc finger n=1 Tax=Fusarium albosuccineum TaxID=1237068 RepID=A0A8H4PG58_9HYPO|nr:c6 zinc finger [Fusarium albosuccineum]
MDSFSPLAMRKMDRAAASRQKSCNACVRGKRKCDKKTPRCTRCAAKNLDCVYQRLPPGASFHDDDDDIVGANNVSHEVPDFDMGFDINNLGSTSASTSTTSNATPESLGANVSIHLDSPLDFSIIDHLMANSSQAGSELWNLGDYGASKMDIPPVPSQAPLAVRDMSLLDRAQHCMADFNPLDVHDKHTRVGYVVDFMSHIYRDFARTRTLPFIHPRLYGSNLPRTMLAAFSAASAYTARTQENKAWVYKLITDVAKDIHREGERASTPAEKLARVQALVILDSVRVFDGDVPLRAASEREMPQFLSWVEALHELRVELDKGETPAAPVTKEQPPATWESWVLVESMRRTVLMSYSFIAICYILRSLEPPCQAMETPLEFTASRYLWDADSSVAFFRAWQTKPQYSVSNLDFKDVWLHARPEDIDGFTKLMLTAQMGTDAMDHFMIGNAGVAV